MLTNLFSSIYVVPVAGCLMVLGLGVAGIYSEIEQKKLRAQQRMALVARGMSADEIEKLLGTANNDDTPVRDPLRSLGNARRAATVLISCGIGLVILGLLLSVILQLRVVLSASAAGVIPIAIGLGFLMDYRMQARELARFGLEVDADSPAKR
jgi:hypothetical protein